MDMMMEPDGHEASKRIIRQYPKAKIIIITSLLDDNGEVSENRSAGRKKVLSLNPWIRVSFSRKWKKCWRGKDQ